MVSEALQYTALWFLSFNLLGNCMSLFADRIAASLTALSGDGRDLKRALKQQSRNREAELVAEDDADEDASASASGLARHLHEENVRTMQKAIDEMLAARTAAWNRTGLLMRTIAAAGGLAGGLVAYYG